MLAASEPGAFDIKQAVPVLTAASTGTEGSETRTLRQVLRSQADDDLLI